MDNERRSETPVIDTRVRMDLSVSIILQGLILSGIIAMVTVMVGLREDLREATVVQKSMLQTQQDHELRIRQIERGLGK